MLDFIAVTHLFPSKSTSYPQFYPHISIINGYFSAIAVKNLQWRYFPANKRPIFAARRGLSSAAYILT